MKRKHMVMIGIGSICILTAIILICFYSISRISYAYDSSSDTYYVDKVYGNARSYEIEEFINDKPVTKIRSKAFMNKTNLESIKLSENIIEIERLAFLDCTNLKEINLDKVEVIGRNAFENCRSLEEVHLTVENVAGGIFMGCSSLKSVQLENTKSIGTYAFAFTTIEKIVFPNTTISIGVDAFYHCECLKKIIVLSSVLKGDSYLNSLEYVEFQSN